MLDKSEKPAHGLVFSSSASFSFLPTALLQRSDSGKLPFCWPKIRCISFWPIDHFHGDFLNELISRIPSLLSVDFISVFPLHLMPCRKDQELSAVWALRSEGGEGRPHSDFIHTWRHHRAGAALESDQARPLGNVPQAALLRCSVIAVVTTSGLWWEVTQLLWKASVLPGHVISPGPHVLVSLSSSPIDASPCLIS